MNTVALWYLITVGGYNRNEVIYSPPMLELETCKFVKKSIEETSPYVIATRCIQIKTVVTK